jgi:hypothetical protein
MLHQATERGYHMKRIKLAVIATALSTAAILASPAVAGAWVVRH